MKLNTFLNIYKSNIKEEEKQKLIQARFKNNYVTFSNKTIKANEVINKSFFENGSIKINSARKYLFSCMSLIDLYTDLDYDKSDKGICDEFDKLNIIGFFDLLLSIVDEREMKEYNMILDMTASDIIQNYQLQK